ncbi:MAG: SDR family NAD(P)-dependent oxidoreductase, partial [Methanobacterium sp.]|nr:SDR family NAD(P)-dependent oxidoreductase [Methanobacterium sp.]
MENYCDLNGKVAVVTGASGGLGADAAMAYAQYGADVALLARRKERLEALAEEIESTGRKALAVQCDVVDEESVET